MNDVESFFPFVLVVITTVTATAACCGSYRPKKESNKGSNS